MGKLIGNYLFGNEKALVIIHLLNYNKLNETEKKFVFMVFNSDGTAGVNHKNNYFVYFSEKANFNIKKNKNIFATDLNRGFTIKGQGYGNGLKKFTDMSFQYLIVYEINEVIPRFLFTENHYTLTDNLSIYKKIYQCQLK